MILRQLEASTLELQQRRLPLRLAEAHEHEVLAHHDRALDQHAVLGEQREGIGVGEPGVEKGLDVALAVEAAARVEEATGRPERSCQAASSSAVGLSSTMWRSV